MMMNEAFSKFTGEVLGRKSRKGNLNTNSYLLENKKNIFELSL